MSLENVAVGDVLVCDSHGRLRVRAVKRVTKTQITVGKRRYRKSDGYEIGHGITYCDRVRQP